jgi:hypothetical protein
MNQMQQNYDKATTFVKYIAYVFQGHLASIAVSITWETVEIKNRKYNNVIFKFPAYFKTFN